MRGLAFLALALAGCNAILGIDEPTLQQGTGGADITIMKAFGQGLVVSNPAGLACKRDCTNQTASFPAGQSVRLTATGAPGYAFASWDGCPSVDGTACVVDRTATVTANFGPIGSNIIFITSMTFNGSLGGVEGGDARCLSAAASGLLPDSTTFKALLSSSSESAHQHLGSARGFVRPDGLPVADTVDDLLINHRMWYAADLTEAGEVSTVNQAWTGSTRNGDGGTSDCNGWIANDSGTDAEVGQLHGGPHFVDSTSAHCDSMLPLICVQTSHTQALAAPAPASGKLAFLSNNSFTPSSGLAAANALCDGEKPAAASGKAVALLATSARSARSLLTAPAYVRPDGIPIDPFADSASTGIWVHGDGSYAQPTPDGSPPHAVWNGSQVFGATPTAQGHTCGDWSATTGMGDIGFLTAGVTGWGANKVSCAQPLPVYCIEQ